MKKFYSHLDYDGPGTISYLFRVKYGFEEVLNPKDADIIVWNGGEDIATSIYGEQPALRGQRYLRSDRDETEIELFDAFKKDESKLLVGICRGAQLLNCLNGGWLWQDVDGHGQSHKMIDIRTKEVLRVTSTHHQQMRPNTATCRIIGVSDCSRYKNSENGPQIFGPAKDLEFGHDLEIAYYPVTRSLLIQGHPEYVPNSRFADYTLELINECMKEIKSFAA